MRHRIGKFKETQNKNRGYKGLYRGYYLRATLNFWGDDDEKILDIEVIGYITL